MGEQAVLTDASQAAVAWLTDVLKAKDVLAEALARLHAYWWDKVLAPAAQIERHIILAIFSRPSPATGQCTW